MAGKPTGRSWAAGNANDDVADTRGWLVGYFIDPSHGLRATEHLEVKWAYHSTGDRRPEWTADDQRTTLVVLIFGEFRVNLMEGSKTMERRGDYMIWGPGNDHSWEALSDSLVVTVRWPSIQGSS